MSNAKKPSVQRKPPTRRAKSARQAALERVIAIRVDGEVYSIRLGDVTGLVDRRVVTETGKSVEVILDQLDVSGVYGLGLFVWICRLTRGDDVELDDILGALGYGADIEVVERPEDDRPEA